MLGGIIKLKQVCNHPAQFLQDRAVSPDDQASSLASKNSSKSCLPAGDKALCFTQFAEWGELLLPHLAASFRRTGVVAARRMRRSDRDRMVAEFQAPDGPPLFLLSLKAGGTGLNLTARQHVIHLDRWWNPAVEDQATDRAFRIGQNRNVLVHKLVATGTLEERIASMIERKRALVGKVIGTGESWITDLSNDELRALLAYDATAEDD